MRLYVIYNAKTSVKNLNNLAVRCEKLELSDLKNLRDAMNDKVSELDKILQTQTIVHNVDLERTKSVKIKSALFVLILLRKLRKIVQREIKNRYKAQ